jgi:hypothetical protein
MKISLISVLLLVSLISGCATTAVVSPQVWKDQDFESTRDINIYFERIGGDNFGDLGDLKNILPNFQIVDLAAVKPSFNDTDICLTVTNLGEKSELFKKIAAVLTLTIFPYFRTFEYNVKMSKCVHRDIVTYETNFTEKTMYGFFMPFGPFMGFKSSSDALSLIIKRGIGG